MNEILIGSVTGSYGVIILYVISGIAERGEKAGIQPKGGTSQFLNIVQLFDNSVKITDTVSIGITEGLGINFIEYGIVKPFRLFSFCAHR